MSVIVVGFDQSPGSQSALEWALEEARLRAADVRIVHAVASTPTYYPYAAMSDIDSDPTRVRQAEAEAREHMASAVAKAGGEPPGVSVELLARPGPAPGTLVEESEGAALLVVGSRGRGGFAGLLLGSVSQQVAQHARCPVVVIPNR